MCIACILFCLTLFSCHLCGGLYARYTTTASAGDSARVARFDVSEDCASFDDTFMIETVPGTTEREIFVKNDSEVAINYIVTIENTTQNIPVTFSVNGSEPALDKCVATFYMEPMSTNQVVIKAIWSDEGALEYMGMVDLIKLSIRAEQVD